jgi:hypothetical protein
MMNNEKTRAKIETIRLLLLLSVYAFQSAACGAEVRRVHWDVWQSA